MALPKAMNVHEMPATCLIVAFHLPAKLYNR